MRRARDDRGNYMILFAVAGVALMTMASLVIDIGQLAVRTRLNQSIADMAALAGAKDLAAGRYQQACQAAITFLNSNAPDMPAINGTNFCSQSGNDVSATTCTGGPLTQAAPTVTSGKYTITIHFPVPDSEISNYGYGVGLNDGPVCQRMRVIVTTVQPTLLSGFTNRASFNATRSATVRPNAGKVLRVPALWLLDPTGCTSLAVSGGSVLTVGATTPSRITGIIAVDSDGSTCASNQHTVSVTGAGTSVTAIPTSGSDAGSITLRAQPPGAALCQGTACDPADVSGGRLSPQPVYGDRPTRAPVDWRFNCNATYPLFHGVVVPGCPYTSTVPPFIDNLRAAVGTSGSPAGSYQRWTNSYSCNPTGTVTVTGNWWIDCNAGLSIGNGTTLTFAGGNIVMDKGLSMTGGVLNVNTANPSGTLPSSCRRIVVIVPCIEASSSGASLVYLRSGDLNITGGQLNFQHTTVYQSSGYLKIAAASPPTWFGSIEGAFTGLAYWSELSSGKFQINGGSGVNLGGAFFTPEAAPFSLGGGGNWGQQSAQFISFQLAVSGGGVISMAPDPQAVVDLPPTSGSLIR